MKKFKFLVASTLLLSLLVFSIPATTNADAFSDVSPDDYHFVAITYLKENNIISGYDDGSFKANQKINRAEALKMLMLAVNPNLSLSTPTESPFTDTPADAWFTPYLIEAKDKGVISGYDDGSFKPDQNVNLVETLKMYLESFDNIIYPDPAPYLFADTPYDAWYTSYTAYAAQRGLLEIHSTNEIYPDMEISRGYLAEIIYRMIKSSEGLSFGKATYYYGRNMGEEATAADTFYSQGLTSAHQTLPFGTIVEVTNLANGKTVQVKINDRGPYGPGRVLDLSKTAFSLIADPGTGVINVEYKVIE